MSSEWMRVMLEEIERKKVEAEQASAEQERRQENLSTTNDPPKG